MPNNCINRVTVAIRKGHTGDAAAIAAKLEDFNTILPMPREFEDVISGGSPIEGIGTEEQAAPYYGWQRVEGSGPMAGQSWISFRFWREKDGKLAPIPREEGEALAKKHGCFGWYDWCHNHWGTKWNAYDFETRSAAPAVATVVFTTAWSPPTPVLEALAHQHPECTIVNRWEEEGGQSGFDLIEPKTPEQRAEDARASAQRMQQLLSALAR